MGEIINMKTLFKYIVITAGCVSIFLTGQSVQAQGVPPSPTPVQCGIANDPNRNKCCPTIRVKDRITDEFRALGSAVVPGPIADIVAGIMNVVVQNMYGIKEMEALQVQCLNGVADPATANNPNQCTCIIPEKPVENVTMTKLCEKYIDQENRKGDYDACIACATGENINGQQGLGGYYSSLGCVPASLEDFVSNYVLRIGIGLAGLISLGCIIYSSILLQTSKGDPEVIQKARDQITSCIIGLLMIIFSTLILRIIGVDILRIPGFG